MITSYKLNTGAVFIERSEAIMQKNVNVLVNLMVLQLQLCLLS